MRGAALVLGLALAVGAGEIALRLLGFGHPVLYDNRSAYGYRPRPNQTTRRLGGARIHINNVGTRGPDVTPTHGPDVLRLLFLGDSVTYGGSYVDEDDLLSAVAARTVAARLPGRFTRVEALDAGVNAWGPQNILGLVQADGGYGSDAWVIVALEDDFRREKTRIGEVPYFNRAPRTAWEELLVFGAYTIATAYKEPKPAADLERVGLENLAAYRAIVEAGRAAGVRVLVAWHPTEPALGGAPEAHRGALETAVRALGATFVDLTAAYRAGTAALFVDGLHLSVAGHRVAGEVLGAALAEEP
jgi:hypothetical protein